LSLIACFIRCGYSLLDLGFTICATAGTATVLNASGVSACRVLKVHEGRPNIVDMIKNHEIQLIINTPLGRRGKDDALSIRREALAHHIPTITTIPGAAAAVTGIESLAKGGLTVKSLQEYHAGKTF
jgi:carbamoyl-phosphate synthase large subunit